MVEVFKTNVHQEDHAARLLDTLGQTFPSFRSNFDLDDCDRILRVEGHEVLPAKIIDVLRNKGFHCSVLD